MVERKEIKCTVVSFVPFDLVETKPGCYPPTFYIKASDTKIPSILHVGKTFHGVYIDETRGSLKVENSPDVVAESIVNDYVNSNLGISDDAQPGIFWIPGDWSVTEILQKFPEECKRAQTQNEEWFRACCRIADDDFNKYRQHNVVSEAQRKMAVLLGWDPKAHEWMMPKSVIEANMDRCFACKSVLNASDQKVCHVCKAILVKDDNLVFAN